MDKKTQLLIDRFIDECRASVRSGQAYTAVILCHEYFRFLFPYEPYAKFTQRDPLRLTVKRLVELTRAARDWRRTVHAYPPALQGAVAAASQSASLESRTSGLYGSLWKRFDEETLWKESLGLVKKRIPDAVIRRAIRGKRVLDMGCGSGRFTVALARLGAREVVGTDLDQKSYEAARRLCRKRKLPVTFREANFHRLPFKTGEFDFVFCNGTLHHSSSIEKGLSEYERVLKPGGEGFLYLYADGGVFWYSRRKMRELFSEIPPALTDAVLRVIGMPAHRFIFQDVWYVPRETHTSRVKLESMLKKTGLAFEKVFSQNIYDLDRAIEAGVKDAVPMWGDGEHRYLLRKGKNRA
jgi:ubiquinone/menaquinone biosynthesis C-methylase UbiE